MNNTTIKDPPLLLRRFNCDMVRVNVRCPTTEFDAERFVATVLKNKARPFAMATTCNTKNKRVADYHVHGSITEGVKDLVLSASFHQGATKIDRDEKPPFAHEFLGWVAGFYSAQAVDIRVTADFVYSLTRCRPIFPLPTELSPMVTAPASPILAKATIGGVRVWFAANDSNVTDAIIEVIGDRLGLSISQKTAEPFAHFNVRDSLTSLHQRSMALTAEKKT